MDRRTLLLGAALLGGCTSALGTFNTFAPHDRGARRVARSVAYGDGPRRVLDIYAPENPPASAPVVVFFHGGSWASGEIGEYSFVGDAFASAGFVTALGEYRLYPEVRFPSFLEDAASVVQWTRTNIARYGGDPDRVVLMGHSAGAYIAVMLALDPRYLGDEVGKLRGVAGLSGPYDFYPFDVASTRNAFGAAPDPSLTQPLHFVRADAPPLYLTWGERDAVVGRKSIVNLERAIHDAGGRVETKIYPGVDHAGTLLSLSRPFRGRTSEFEDVSGFFRRVTA